MKQKVRFPFAVIALAILLLTSFTSSIRQIVMIAQDRWYYDTPGWNITVAVLFGLCMLVLLAATILFVLLKKRNVILPVLIGGFVLFYLAEMYQIIFFLRQYVSAISVRSLMFFYSYVLLFVFVLALSEKKEGKNDVTDLKAIVSKFYYLPAAVCLGNYIIHGLWDIISRLARGYLFSGFFGSFLGGVEWIATAAFMFLLMMWLKDPYVAENTTVSVPETKTEPAFDLAPSAVEEPIVYSGTPSYDPEAPLESVAPANEGSVYEQLKKYKSYLDSGVITQEEFDNKKKQLLGF